jgi:hypothetical protein
MNDPMLVPSEGGSGQARISGLGLYDRLRAVNDWTALFLPNATGLPVRRPVRAVGDDAQSAPVRRGDSGASGSGVLGQRLQRTRRSALNRP